MQTGGFTRHTAMRVFVTLMLMAACALAQEVVFRGTPTLRVLTTHENEARQTIEPAAAEKSACVITKKGKRFYWASRDNAEMMRTESPTFTYFVHAGGSGYVKVFKGDPRVPNPPADYVEHISMGFQTMTYWGKTAGAR